MWVKGRERKYKNVSAKVLTRIGAEDTCLEENRKAKGGVRITDPAEGKVIAHTLLPSSEKSWLCLKVPAAKGSREAD